jgi:hypothetical protein
VDLDGIHVAQGIKLGRELERVVVNGVERETDPLFFGDFKAASPVVPGPETSKMIAKVFRSNLILYTS